MIIEEISLENFRNYKNQKVNLNEGINVFYGNNAQGKTNLLESIFICAIGKSFRTNKEKELINFDSDKAKFSVSYKKSDRDGKITLELSDKKKILHNDVLLKKTSEILGNIYVVLFTPDDISILKGGPVYRRRFLDIMISQLRPTYMHLLSQYNKTLLQRNSCLRQIKLSNMPKAMLDVWDEKLVEFGEKIFRYREEFIHRIEYKLWNIHCRITDKKEEISIKYISSFKGGDEFRKKLVEHRDSDIQRGSTSIGTHRDDFIMTINGKTISVYGSQGQHRTAILSLKIAELEIIQDEVGEFPILLLDDFMSELDEFRRNNLLLNMTNNQVIITCTDKTFFENLDASFFKVENGNVIGGI